MEGFLIFAILGLIGLGVLYERYRAERAELAVRRAHYVLGDDVELVEGPHGLGLRGELSGREVTVRRAERKKGRERQSFFELAVAADDVIPRELSIRVPGALWELKQALGGGGDITNGLGFTCQVDAPDSIDLLALLDANTRTHVRELLTDNGLIAEGELRLERPLSTRGDRMVAWLRSLVERADDIAARWRPREQKLLLNARNDPLDSVRRQCLIALLEAHPDTREAREAAFLALSRDEHDLWLRAAEMLGVEATEEARRATANRDRELWVRRVAMSLAIDSLPAREAAIVLEPILEASADPLYAEAARGLHRFDLPRALAHADAGLDDDDFAYYACDSLANLRHPEVDKRLLALLERPNPTVQRAACQALGRSGSVGAVERLAALAKGLLRPASVKDAAREAIEAIQQRAGERLPGALSLASADGEEGHLSIVDEAGALSLSDD